MITDQTIETDTAKYWCAFSDKDLEKKLNDATSFTKEDGKRLAGVLKKAKVASKKVSEGMWDNAQAAHQAAFPLATGNPLQPNFRGMDPSSGVKSLQDQGKDNIIAGAIAAALVGLSYIPGGWAALTSAIGAASSSVITTLLSAGASLGTAGLSALVGGIVTISSYLYPRIAEWLKGIRRNNCIAQCNFISNDTPYIVSFSLSTGKWELLYANNRWIRMNAVVPADEKAQFFSTKFFNKFNDKCKKNLSVIFDNPKNKELVKTLAKMSDKDSSKALMQFLDSEKSIRSHMFNGTYVESCKD